MRRNIPRRELLALGLALSGGCLRLTTESDSSTEDDQATSKRTQTTAVQTKTQTDSSTTQETDQTKNTDQTEAAETDVEYPNGVDENGVSETLALTHKSLVAAENCTVTKTADRGYSTRTVERKIGTAKRAYVTESEGPSTIEKWFESSSEYVKAAFGSENLYTYNSDRFFDRERFVETRLLRKLIQTGKYEPVDTKREDGTNYIVIEAEEKESDAIAEWEGQTEVTSFEGSGIVTEDGLIRELTATYTMAGRQRETYRTKIETTDIGSTTVSEPDWTDTAKKRAPTFDVSITADKSFVTVEHTGGDGIPIDVGVNLSPKRTSGARHRDARLKAGIKEGETIYFYKDGTESLGFSRGQKPDAEPEPFEYDQYVAIFARRLSVLETEIDV